MLPSPVELPKTNFTIQYANSEETSDRAANAIDGNSGSNWHTRWSGGAPPGYPHEIQINLSDTFNVSSIKYLPSQDGNTNGRVANYEICVTSNRHGERRCQVPKIFQRFMKTNVICITKAACSQAAEFCTTGCASFELTGSREYN